MVGGIFGICDLMSWFKSPPDKESNTVASVDNHIQKEKKAEEKLPVAIREAETNDPPNENDFTAQIEEHHPAMERKVQEESAEAELAKREAETGKREQEAHRREEEARERETDIQEREERARLWRSVWGSIPEV
jgi:hypothetical protein